MRLVLTMLVLASGALACATTPKAPLFTIDQDELERAVVARLAADEQLAAEAIAVDVEGSTVRLTGTVADEDRRRRAAALALGARGVRAVVNRLAIADSQATGAERTGP